MVERTLFRETTFLAPINQALVTVTLGRVAKRHPFPHIRGRTTICRGAAAKGDRLVEGADTLGLVQTVSPFAIIPPYFRHFDGMGVHMKMHRSPMRGSIAVMLLLSSGKCCDMTTSLRELHIARMSILAERHGVRIGLSPGKGYGVFAVRLLKAEETVGDYVGEHLTQRDVDARYFRRGIVDIHEVDREWIESRARRGVTSTGNCAHRPT
jgi:hypothetical protein